MTRDDYITARNEIRAEMKGLVEQVLYAKSCCRRARQPVFKTTRDAVLWGVNMTKSQSEAALLKNRIAFLHSRIFLAKQQRQKTLEGEKEDEARWNAMAYQPMDAIDEHNEAIG